MSLRLSPDLFKPVVGALVVPALLHCASGARQRQDLPPPEYELRQQPHWQAVGAEDPLAVSEEPEEEQLAEGSTAEQQDAGATNVLPFDARVK